MPLLWCNVPLTAAYMWQPYCTMVGAFLWLMCALKWWAVKVYHTSEFTPSYNVYVLLCLCAHITRAAARTYLYSLWHYTMYRKDIFGVCKYLVKLLHVGGARIHAPGPGRPPKGDVLLPCGRLSQSSYSP